MWTGFALDVPDSELTRLELAGDEATLAHDIGPIRPSDLTCFIHRYLRLDVERQNDLVLVLDTHGVRLDDTEASAAAMEKLRACTVGAIRY